MHGPGAVQVEPRHLVRPGRGAWRVGIVGAGGERPARESGDQRHAHPHGEPRQALGLPAAAFAAAFFCFLKSRTFCSDSGSTTSATER